MRRGGRGPQSTALGLAAFGLLTLFPRPASGQAADATTAPWAELGIDTSVQVAIPDGGDRLTTVEVPLGRVRAGAYAGSRWLFELSLGFVLASQTDRSSSAGRGDIGLAYHFGSDARRTRPFIVVGAGGRYARSDGNTLTQALTFGGLGVKAPLGRVVALRIEADYARAFGTADFQAAHELRAIVGLSFLLGG